MPTGNNDELVVDAPTPIALSSSILGTSSDAKEQSSDSGSAETRVIRLRSVAHDNSTTFDSTGFEPSVNPLLRASVDEYVEAQVSDWERLAKNVEAVIAGLKLLKDACDPHATETITARVIQKVAEISPFEVATIGKGRIRTLATAFVDIPDVFQTLLSSSDPAMQATTVAIAKRGAGIGSRKLAAKIPEIVADTLLAGEDNVLLEYGAEYRAQEVLVTLLDSFSRDPKTQRLHNGRLSKLLARRLSGAATREIPRASSIYSSAGLEVLAAARHLGEIAEAFQPRLIESFNPQGRTVSLAV